MSIIDIRARQEEGARKRLELGGTICRTVTRKAAALLTLTRCPETLGPSYTSQLALAVSKLNGVVMYWLPGRWDYKCLHPYAKSASLHRTLSRLTSQ